MLESPAYRTLSLSARRVLDRIEIELAHHGGKDNGRLPVTFDDFLAYGIHRHAIGPAIREAVALGFVEITRPGRAGNAEWRLPNLFRLTYRPAKNLPGDGSHEWKSITDLAEAERLAGAARKNKPKSQCRKLPSLGDENRHRKRKIHGTESTTTAHGANSGTTLDISGKGQGIEPAREARPSGSAVASEPAETVARASVDDVQVQAKVQARLAQRLGKHGWSALMALTEQELHRVTKLEAAGSLDKMELMRLHAIGMAAGSAVRFRADSRY
jgi:hypothetical protein